MSPNRICIAALYHTDRKEIRELGIVKTLAEIEVYLTPPQWVSTPGKLRSALELLEQFVANPPWQDWKPFLTECIIQPLKDVLDSNPPRLGIPQLPEAALLCQHSIFASVRELLAVRYRSKLQATGIQKVRKLLLHSMDHGNITSSFIKFSDFKFQECLRYERYSYKLSLFHSEKNTGSDLIQACKYAHAAVEWCTEKFKLYAGAVHAGAKDGLGIDYAHLDIELAILVGHEAEVGERFLNYYYSNTHKLPEKLPDDAPCIHLKDALRSLHAARLSIGNQDSYDCNVQRYRCHHLEARFRKELEIAERSLKDREQITTSMRDQIVM